MWRISAWDQFWLCLISLSVLLLDTAPMEIQRRIIDQTVYSGNFAIYIVMPARLHMPVPATPGRAKTYRKIGFGCSFMDSVYG